MAAVLLIGLRPGRWPLWPVPPAGAALAVAGGILLLMSPFDHQPQRRLSPSSTSPSWPLLEPIVTVGLAWLALAAAEVQGQDLADRRHGDDYAVISIVGGDPRRTPRANSAAAFLTALFGNLLS